MKVPEISFVVAGSPVAKGRPRLGRNGVYTPEKTRAYERKVKYYAQKAMGNNEPIDSCVSVDVIIYIGIPKSFSKIKREKALSGEIRPLSKPDVDNCFKAVTDPCNGIVYTDDSHICEISASKHYSANPRVEITVTWQ